ncbi:hypothetical protein [Aliikangiella sp. G2MR2-5]|uniref:hypothetical protein n=1 Tax=Aliikangiella sp. G2MR2-5 TaxID=2788943 RepID=UPI0018AAB809|nr:hypothetical protein [Aliikangiella sp. G2MR2-5]
MMNKTLCGSEKADKKYALDDHKLRSVFDFITANKVILSDLISIKHISLLASSSLLSPGDVSISSDGRVLPMTSFSAKGKVNRNVMLEHLSSGKKVKVSCIENYLIDFKIFFATLERKMGCNLKSELCFSSSEMNLKDYSKMPIDMISIQLYGGRRVYVDELNDTRTLKKNDIIYLCEKTHIEEQISGKSIYLNLYLNYDEECISPYKFYDFE